MVGTSGCSVVVSGANSLQRGDWPGRRYPVGPKVDLSAHGVNAWLSSREPGPLMVSVSTREAGAHLPLDAAEQLAEGILRLVREAREMRAG